MSRVAAEPELKRYEVQRRKRSGTLECDVGALGANHSIEASLLLSSHGELIPDVHPNTVVLVHLLAANLYLDGVDQGMADSVGPAEAGEISGATSGERQVVGGQRRELNLQEHLVDEVAVARNQFIPSLSGYLNARSASRLRLYLKRFENQFQAI